MVCSLTQTRTDTSVRPRKHCKIEQEQLVLNLFRHAGAPDLIAVFKFMDEPITDELIDAMLGSVDRDGATAAIATRFA